MVICISLGLVTAHQHRVLYNQNIMRQLQQVAFLARNPRGNLNIPLGISIPPWPQYSCSVFYVWLDG